VSGDNVAGTLQRIGSVLQRVLVEVGEQHGLPGPLAARDPLPDASSSDRDQHLSVHGVLLVCRGGRQMLFGRFHGLAV
jgi:hypothetical protein